MNTLGGDFENCTVCGRVYAFLARGVCADCLNDRERRFHDVRDWLRANPTATIEAAAEATETDVELILQWIREGRIRRAPQPGDVGLAELHAAEERRRHLREELGAAVEQGPSTTSTTPHRGFNSRRNHNA